MIRVMVSGRPAQGVSSAHSCLHSTQPPCSLYAPHAPPAPRRWCAASTSRPRRCTGARAAAWWSSPPTRRSTCCSTTLTWRRRCYRRARWAPPRGCRCGGVGGGRVVAGCWLLLHGGGRVVAGCWLLLHGGLAGWSVFGKHRLAASRLQLPPHRGWAVLLCAAAPHTTPCTPLHCCPRRSVSLPLCRLPHPTPPPAPPPPTPPRSPFPVAGGRRGRRGGSV